MEQQQQIPGWIITIIGLGQVVSALALIAIAAVLVMLIGQIKSILVDVQKMVQEDVRKELMPSVAGVLKNAKTISDDAAATTHNVTATVNRVSNIVGSVSGRLESPLIKAVGVATGLLAGAKALRGGPKPAEVVVKPAKKRRGFFG